MLQDFRTYLEMIRSSHTVFALPFAFVGAVLAAGTIPSGEKIVWTLPRVWSPRAAGSTVQRS